MNTEQKKKEIKKLVIEGINNSTELMKNDLIDKALNSGCINIDSWDKNNQPMILVKSILIALFKNEASQYSAKGTSFEKQVKKESNNIQLFL